MTNQRELVVTSGLIKRVRYYNWYFYTNKIYNVSLYEKLLEEGFALEDIFLAEKMNRSWNAKTYRIKKKLFDMQFLAMMCNFNYLFVTFTFKPETLENNKPETLKTYVRRYLKEHSIKYLANVDYGAKNGRIHFHACCICEKNLPLNEWHKYGAIKIEHVRVLKNNEKMLAKYINKLSLHAVKDTTGLQRVISWRKPKKNYGVL